MPSPIPSCVGFTLRRSSRRVLFSVNTWPMVSPSFGLSEVCETSSDESARLMTSACTTGSTTPARELPASDREVKAVFRWMSAPMRWPSRGCRSTPDDKSRLLAPSLPLSGCTGNGDLNSTSSTRL
eukprot:1465167-Prymnesium_polylepis.1